jgi:hypothetical protein
MEVAAHLEIDQLKGCVGGLATKCASHANLVVSKHRASLPEPFVRLTIIYVLFAAVLPARPMHSPQRVSRPLDASSPAAHAERRTDGASRSRGLLGDRGARRDPHGPQITSNSSNLTRSPHAPGMKKNLSNTLDLSVQRSY